MLAVLTTVMGTENSDGDKGLEVISESNDPDVAFLDLMDELFRTASEQYSATVLDWFANEPSRVLEMMNGEHTFETWHWAAD